MGFVNEISTPEDNEKYRLHEVRRKYSIYRQDRHGMSVDRERGIVLIKTYSGSPRTDDVGKHHFALIVGDEDFGFTMHCENIRLDNNRRVYNWDLLKIDNQPNSANREAFLIELLKEALTVYGYQGPQRFNEHVPQFSVHFNF